MRLLISIWKLKTTSASSIGKGLATPLCMPATPDNQFDTSIEDQLRLCRERAERKAGRVAES